MRYSIKPRDQIYDLKLWLRYKSYGFLSFAKHMGKNIGKSISKKLNRKHYQKLHHHTKKLATDPLTETSKRAI